MAEISEKAKVSLLMHRFFGGDGEAYTAFIGISDEEWRAFIDGGASNLMPLREKIIRLIRGHEPAPHEIEDAKRAFTILHPPLAPEGGDN
jgi:hypothetical protein